MNWFKFVQENKNPNSKVRSHLAWLDYQKQDTLKAMVQTQAIRSR